MCSSTTEITPWRIPEEFSLIPSNTKSTHIFLSSPQLTLSWENLGGFWGGSS